MVNGGLVEITKLNVSKPKNISNYFKLSAKGFFISGLLARANGVSEEKIQENIQKVFKNTDSAMKM